MYQVEEMGCHTRVRKTPLHEGYLSNTCAMPHESKESRMRYLALPCYLEKVLRDIGGG